MLLCQLTYFFSKRLGIFRPIFFLTYAFYYLFCYIISCLCKERQFYQTHCKNISIDKFSVQKLFLTINQLVRLTKIFEPYRIFFCEISGIYHRESISLFYSVYLFDERILSKFDELRSLRQDDLYPRVILNCITIR